MRSTVVAAASVVAFVGASTANVAFADGPPMMDPPAPEPEPIEFVEPVVVEPVINWGGFYVGVNVGYAMADFNGAYDGADDPSEDFDDPDGDFDGLFFDELDFGGASVGGHLGYNVVVEDVVLGAELTASTVVGSQGISAIDEGPANADQSADQSADARVNAFGSMRLRAGLPIGAFMPFVSGGVGLVNYSVEIDDDGGSNNIDGVHEPETDEFSATAFAPVVGGGVDWMVTENIIVRAEGVYYFVNKTIELDDLIDSDAGDSFEIENLLSVRGSVSFKF